MSGEVLETVERLSRRALESYAQFPERIEEDANGERRIFQGGYGDRQIFELVQNAADELRASDQAGGRIHVVLTEDHLYCANQGTPMTAEGVDTILRMGVSKKRSGEIGRFGVGVKSVLSVTRTPQFFSRTGSFGFDADWSAKEILKAVNTARRDQGQDAVTSVGDTPVLRMARALNEDVELARDPILRELMGWASTAVRLPLMPGWAETFSHDLQRRTDITGDRTDREFPGNFQLFSPHVGTVVFDDRRTMPARTRALRVESSEGFTTIVQSRNGSRPIESSFRVFTVAHEVSDETRENAGELHDRSTIDVTWAVPDYKINPDTGLSTIPADRGTFWSYFPTKYSTTLSGVLNAAWKTNEDRQNLLDSAALNRELLTVAANLVVDSLEGLVVESDPAAYLALLPGRTRESPNWACASLTGQVWKLAAECPSLPDQLGSLRRPADLRVHPDGISSKALEIWRSYAGRPTNWVHHSVDAQSVRRGKMNHILEAAHISPAETVRTWLEALVENGSVEASATAIRVAGHIIGHDAVHPGDSWSVGVRGARIIRTESGEMVAAETRGVFRKADEDGLEDDLVYVDPELSADSEVARILDGLGIRESDAEGRFRSVLDRGFDHYRSAQHWVRFWELLNRAGGPVQSAAIRRAVENPAAVLQVRTVAGGFAPVRDTLLPGAVVPGDGSRDAEIAVDMRFHANDLVLLRDLGAVEGPEKDYNPDREAWFEDYRTAIHAEYREELGVGGNPVRPQTLRLQGGRVSGPLRTFRRLSEEGRAVFLAALPESRMPANWTRQEGRRSQTSRQVVSPICWLIREYGYVETARGLRRVTEAVGPQLGEFGETLPVARISAEKARLLRMPTSVDEVDPDEWTSLLDRVRTSADDAFVGATYAQLIRVAGDLLLEETGVRCRVGDHWEMRPDTEIAVARTRTEYDELIREHQPAILVDRPSDSAQADHMVEEWGMLRVADVIEKKLRWVASGPRTALGDEYPALRRAVPRRRWEGLELQRCSELEEVVRTPNGTSPTGLASARQGDVLLVANEMSIEDVLVAADEVFEFELGRSGAHRLLEAHRKSLEDRERKERLKEIRAAGTIPEKLALMLSESELRESLPESLLESEIRESGRQPDIARLAQLVYRTHDDAALKECGAAIQQRFPDAPSRYNGGNRERFFVQSLGFPDSFAGSTIQRPPEREEAAGPTDFPALHDYQEEIATRLVALLRSVKPERAMLSLPTGAGKTRVAAEGVIRWIRSSGVPAGPILWIAQTTELCEQAVQSWKFVWEKVGADQPLVIDRFWEGNSATGVSGRPHLVVATDAKLKDHIDTDEYAWLREAALVIVDEAHTAISPQYTAILKSLGLTHNRSTRHLVGLTATPFRNDEELTRRLVQRFGDRRLDEGVLGDEPITRLQELGILSRVEHRQLKGTVITLDEDERGGLGNLTEKGFLPRSAERRIAENDARNRLLVEEIVKLPEDWPILVFATSVDHAKVLAAKLCDAGVRSVAIDSATPVATRRQRIEDFRNGKIRVVTNYGVLSQGFDAPATRAVVIARPVYSGNVYQQMVGRGLRGVMNGGKSECLILDVKDNITNFDKNLAFTEFEHLWQR